MILRPSMEKLFGCCHDAAAEVEEAVGDSEAAAAEDSSLAVDKVA